MYKIGDRVRFIRKNSPSTCFTYGQIYTVGGAFHGMLKNSVGIIADNYGNPNGWDSNFFELVDTITSHMPSWF